MSSPIDIKPAIAAAPSPPALTPAGAGAQRHQSICIKPISAASSPAPTTPCSVTSKEWVIPPRPKPGRKPATDTPPTKRKAQNRAAQRAFRERRAARVGELEEQIKAMEVEDEQEQTAMREEIIQLNASIEQYRGEMKIWIDRCHRLEKELAAERNEREALLREKSSYTDQHSNSPVPLTTSSSHSHVNHEHIESEEIPLGCGGCSATSRCACVEAVLAETTENDTNSHPKRPHSPVQVTSEKRVKAEPVDEPMEIDFTHAFSKPRNPLPQPTARVQDAVSPASNVADRCGFCQDGTPCICAEMAAENRPVEDRYPHNQHNQENTRIPSIRELSQFTPPPSDGDVSLPPAPPPSTDSCANGPGTCAQCQADPNSTLFCKTLAAARARLLSSQPSSPAGCCGGSRNGQGCCQSQSRTLPPPIRRPTNSSLDSPQESQSQSSSLTLSCADAYTTLSRHPNYERAISSGDAGSWIPKLYASPSRHLGPGSDDLDKSKGHPHVMSNPTRGRPAMEIEVANVMSVLREFDRRFGSNA